MSELISGKEALIALANGEDVEYIGRTKTWFSLNKEVSSWNVSEVLSSSDAEDDAPYQFRIKPSTITINGIEVPAPFEPKDDCDVFILNDSRPSGYQYYEFNVTDTEAVFFGVWRTEDEIKQVVAALRSIFK